MKKRVELSAEIREGVSLSALRKVGDRLAEHNAAPLRARY